MGGCLLGPSVGHVAAIGTGGTEAWGRRSELGFDKLRLHAPTRPATSHLRGKIPGAPECDSHPELGMVRTLGDLVNQRGELGRRWLAAEGERIGQCVGVESAGPPNLWIGGVPHGLRRRH